MAVAEPAAEGAHQSCRPQGAVVVEAGQLAGELGLPDRPPRRPQVREVEEVLAGDVELVVEVQVRHVVLLGDGRGGRLVRRHRRVERAADDLTVPRQLDDDHVQAALLPLGDETLEHRRVELVDLLERRVVPGEPLLHQLPLLGVGQRVAAVEGVHLVRLGLLALEPGVLLLLQVRGQGREDARQDGVRVLVLTGVVDHPAAQGVALEEQLAPDDLVVVALRAGGEAAEVHADQHRRRRVREVVDDRPALRVALHARAEVVGDDVRPAIALHLAGERGAADEGLAAARPAEQHGQRLARRVLLEVARHPRDVHVVVGGVALPALGGDGRPASAREPALNAEKRRHQECQRHDEHEWVPVAEAPPEAAHAGSPGFTRAPRRAACAARP